MADKTSKTNPWSERIGRCKQRRQQLIPIWDESIDYRRGVPFASESEIDRINIPLDWVKTKTKAAALFSQVPEVRLEAKYPEFGQAVPVFAKQLNEILKKAKVGSAMNECIVDCINASGIGAVVVAYEQRFRIEPNFPLVDKATAQQLQAAGQPVPTGPVKVKADCRFINQRISPKYLLWPTEFLGSDFDQAPWIGRSGTMTWAEAKNAFGLKNSQKDQVVGAGGESALENLRDNDQFLSKDSDCVSFDEIFYKAHFYDADEPSFDRIKHIVFVQGIDEPVFDKDWTGQRLDLATGRYVGALKFPIRILTLEYITDDPIPPSDSEMGRPQVDELIASRTQIHLHRTRSQPVRWFDGTRFDPDTANNLMKGTWNGMVPVQGNGTGMMGELATAKYPEFDILADRVAKSDLDEIWATGPGASGTNRTPVSAEEARNGQRNYDTRVTKDRAKVAEFFVGIAEVTAGLLALYGEFEIDINPAMQGWNRQQLANDVVYFIRPDSTVALEAGQQYERLQALFNIAGPTGLLNNSYLLTKMVELQGLNPSDAMAQPQPKSPEQANISLRLTGAEDLMNPAVIAFLANTGQLPSPDQLEAAKKFVMQAQMPPQPPQPSPEPGMFAEGEGQPPPPLHPDDIEKEDMHTASKIVKRMDYGS